MWVIQEDFECSYFQVCKLDNKEKVSAITFCTESKKYLQKFGGKHLNLLFDSSLFGREGHYWEFYKPDVFSLTINRDTEISVSVYGHKDGPFVESKFKLRMFWLQACVLLSDSATPGKEAPQLQGLNPSSTGGCWTPSQNLQPLTLKNIFRRVSTTSLYCKNLQHLREALRFYACKMTEE